MIKKLRKLSLQGKSDSKEPDTILLTDDLNACNGHTSKFPLRMDKTPLKSLMVNVLFSNDPKLMKYSPKKTLLVKGKCYVTSKISKTLQGSCYHGFDINGNAVVIKRTDKKLTHNKSAKIDHKIVQSCENIVREAKAMSDIQSKKPPPGMIQLIKFIEDDKNYFLIMQDGGMSFLDYINTAQKSISQNKLSIHEWRKHCKMIFRQMVTFIHWLHNTAKYAHMDISLENLTIKDYVIKNGKYVNHGQIYFIDFGLAKSFKKRKDMNNCKKFVGKKGYISPEIAHETRFNASLNDVYSLGVVLFMMTFGIQPYRTPTLDDNQFTTIMNGDISKMITELGKSKFASKSLVSALHHMLCIEDQRISINQLIKHKFLI